jgi:MFS family permease
MAESTFKVYKYRWVVLAVFMFVNLTIQMLWISYSPITGPAAEYYGVSDLYIGWLSMIFMLAFIPFSLPASWAIDSFGFHKAVGFGVILMGVFGVLRGLAGANYSLVFACTLFIAIGQPFLLNAWAKVPARWFAVTERATAVGIVTLANLLGTAIGMVLTPILINTIPISTVQLIYGCIAAFSAVLFLVLAKEYPPTPPCPEGMDVRSLMLDGLKHAFKVKDFLLFLAVSFIGVGIFNGLNTWVEPIIRPRHFSPEEAGILGAVLLVAGLLGAVILPSFSDKQHKRKKFMLLGIVCAIPGVIGVTFAQNYALLLLSGAVVGFFLISVLPIGIQYSAEITYPTPEGTSNGLIQLFGQGAVVFVYIMEAMRTPDGAFTRSLLLGVGLMILCAYLVTRLHDPEFVQKSL